MMSSSLCLRPYTDSATESSHFFLPFAAPLAPPGLDPAGLDPAGLDPAGLDPAGLDPAGLDPAGLDPAGLDPAGLFLARPALALRLSDFPGSADCEPDQTGPAACRLDPAHFG